MRIGNGYDVHRLKEGRPLIIGGVEIPYEKGLDGHSDADVLAHAIIDSLFGAAGLPDIGTHFPDTDPRYKGADSIALLRECVRIIREEGYKVGNIDTIIVAQRPKMMPHIPKMKKIISESMGVDASRVSIKAKTEEGLGFTGNGEGISAYSVALLVRQNISALKSMGFKAVVLNR
ncbi:MAG: 2-C-methyl-D-erythritol 2,4-cyclodiphosphate synthase [Clostridia bacterium]|nr:2-C-methyl-D-erythritol 2,4-cyclodiphosphate synthase [Clostridia bacterium]